MKHRLIFLLAAAVFTVAAGSDPDLAASGARTTTEDASRWGRDGHKIVCEIAYREVEPGVRDRIDALINMDSDFGTFAESCLWADIIRREPGYEKFPTAHYLNAPRGVERVSAAEHCREYYCAIEAIHEMEIVLASTRTSTVARLQALKFLSHFVGDLHQPLHAGYGDDRGGNSARVLAWGEQRNLHAVWDYVLLEHTGLDWETYTERLYARISDGDRTRWSTGSVQDWANESYRVVEESVYDLDGPGSIGDAYFERNIPIIEERLQMAGVRLARMLNQALGPFSDTP